MTQIESEATFSLARAHLKKGESAAAIELLRSLIEQGSDHPGILEAMGVACSMEKDYPRALTWFQATIEEQPDRISSYVNLGAVCNRISDHAQAKKWLHEAIRIDWKSAEANCQLGIAHSRLKEFSEAKDCLQQAMRLRPTLVEAALQMALLFVETGNPRLAVSWFEKVLELNPSHRRARQSIREIREQLDAEQSELRASTTPEAIAAAATATAESTRRPQRQLSATNLKTIQSSGEEVAGLVQILTECFDSECEASLNELRKSIYSGIRPTSNFLSRRNQFEQTLQKTGQEFRRLQGVVNRLIRYDARLRPRPQT